AGLLLALAGLTRFVGVALIAPALLYVSLRRLGWMRAGALAAGFAVPVAAYSLWFQSSSGSLGITDRNGFFLYGRVASFADCDRVDVPAEEEALCLEEPPPQGFVAQGVWTLDVPKRFKTSPDGNRLMLDFSKRMIVAMPLDYARAVGADLLRYFSWTPPPSQEPNVARWRFPLSLPDADPQRLVRRLEGAPPPHLGLDATFRIDASLGGALRAYQGVVYSYGPLLALLLCLGLMGAVGRGAASGKRDLRRESLLFASAALVLLLVPVMTAVYHFRYVLPVLPLLGPAGALGIGALIDRRRARPGAR
ncbi:MAG: hypothetical protein ACRDJ5_00135, partial [Actinomycetota bacterium]